MIALKTWLGLNENKEGRCYWMYEDVKGYMTTGVGNLLPLVLALQLPWKHKDGRLATKLEITAEYDRLKALPGEDDGGFWYKQHATLFLNDEDVDGLVERKLRSIEDFCSRKLRQWEEWPADAQVGVLSMCWAMGQGRVFDGQSYPKFLAHAKNMNFAEYKLKNGVYTLSSGCAYECGISEKGNPGVAPRNRMNKVLFQNAAEVLKRGLCKSELQYPKNLIGKGD